MASRPVQGHLPVSWISVWAPVCLLTPSNSPSTQMMEHQSFARQRLKAGFSFTKASVPITVCKNIPGWSLGNCFRGSGKHRIQGCGAVTVWMSEILSFSAETRGKSKPQNYGSKKWTFLHLSRAPVSLSVEWPLPLTASLLASRRRKQNTSLRTTVRTSSCHFSMVFSACWGLVKHFHFHSFWFYSACNIHMKLKGDHKQGGDPRNNKRRSLWQAKAKRVNCNNKYFAS